MQAIVQRSRASNKSPALDPIAATESIAYDFLAKGGKYSRRFITLAVYDALTGGHATANDGADHIEKSFSDRMASVIATSSLLPGTPRMNERSILSTSIGNCLSCASDE